MSTWLRANHKLQAVLVAVTTFAALVLLAGWAFPLQDAADATFPGADPRDAAGTRVAMVGDVNGDGLDDFLIAATGAAVAGWQRGVSYLFLGRPAAGWGSGFDVTQADAAFRGEGASSLTGRDISAAGDVNGDGYDDFLIGAYHYTVPGVVTETGKVYLLLGRAAADWGQDFDLVNADASFLGEAAGDFFGADLDSAGDVNGDGYDDFLVGAYLNDALGRQNSGKACLFLGRHAAGWGQNVPVSSADASFVGEAAQDFAGGAVAGAGDVNGDGYDDLIIGAYGTDDTGTNSGKVYLILGRAAPNWGTDFNLMGADAVFLGERGLSYAGWAAAGVGDVDGDGLADSVIGANYDGENGTYAGQSYLILGRATADWGSGFSLANADASFRGAHAGDESGSALAGAGDANGDGYADWLIGAHFFEATTNVTDTGRAYLVLGKPTGWLRDTDLSDADVANDILAFDGETNGDEAGTAVAGGGDLNGDGLADLLFGAPGNDDNGDGAGKAYMVLGRGLTLAKAASSAFVPPGQRITYTMRYTNTGYWGVQSVRIIDRIPDGINYINCVGGITCTRQGSLVTWVLGNVVSETAGLVRLIASIPAGAALGTVVTNTAWITSPTWLNPRDSQAVITVGVPPPTPTPTATASRTPSPTATLPPQATATATATATAPVSGCVPSLISPAPGAVLDNGRRDFRDVTIWDFDWSDCPAATAYHLRVAHAEGAAFVDRQDLTASSYHYVNDGYFSEDHRFGFTWKVRAMVDGEWGSWSETRTFDAEPVDTDPPMPTPTPTAVAQRVYLPVVLRNHTQPVPPTPTPTPTVRLVTLEYVYSDQTAESYQSADAGRGFATFFTSVPENWCLVRVRFYLRNPAPIQVHIWDQNKVDRCTPFTASPGADGWLEVDLRGLGLYTTADGFYVGFAYLEGYRPDMGVDTSNPKGHSYEVDGAYFEPRGGLEYMIRVTAEG